MPPHGATEHPQEARGGTFFLWAEEGHSQKGQPVHPTANYILLWATHCSRSHYRHGILLLENMRRASFPDRVGGRGAGRGDESTKYTLHRLLESTPQAGSSRSGPPQARVKGGDFVHSLLGRWRPPTSYLSPPLGSGSMSLLLDCALRGLSPSK